MRKGGLEDYGKVQMPVGMDESIVNTRKAMILQIVEDYKVNYAGFSDVGTLDLLFEDIEEEKRFRKDYWKCLDFIRFIHGSTVQSYKQ